MKYDHYDYFFWHSCEQRYLGLQEQALLTDSGFLSEDRNPESAPVLRILEQYRRR